MKKVNNFLFFIFCLYSITSFGNTKLFNSSSLNYHIVPLKIIQKSPYLTINIEGFENDFILDTGASTAITLSKKITKNLKSINYTSEYHQMIDAAGKVRSSASFIINDVYLGTFHIKEVKGKDHKVWGVYMNEDGETINADDYQGESEEMGVVGLDFFRKKNFIIDYSKSKLIILEGDLLPPEYININWHNTTFSMASDEFVINAVIDNRKRRFLVDTGSTASLFKKSELLTSLNNPTFIETNEFIISKKDFGPMKFLILDYDYPSTDGILGYDFFINHIVYVDFRNNIIKLSASRND